MKQEQLQLLTNPYNEGKVVNACGLFGAMNRKGKMFSGTGVIAAIANMHDRGNGLGGGFAVYGLYPEQADCYALHVMYENIRNTFPGREVAEQFINSTFDVVKAEEIPVQKTPGIVKEPLFRRYFVKPGTKKPPHQSDDDYVIEKVMAINLEIADTFVVSSGKNMGVFKGVGYPEQLAEFFLLKEYSGYLWTAHARFPTNTQAWWGGAHPFNVLDWTVVHNGEISSYGINRRYLEMYGYHCTMFTDTEVIAYATDLLARKHGLPVETVMDVFSPPVWEHIERLEEKEKKYWTALRQTYGSLLLNGPFAIIVAHQGEMIATNDRIRLRPMYAATHGDMVYISSEEASIRLIEQELDKVWIPVGGSPIISRLDK
ncbi:MAG: glutamine amidotransferase family protein [Elusimicrobiota bacterium]